MTVLYFAWIKERTGQAEEEFSLPDNVKTLDDLVTHLKTLSDGHALALADMAHLHVAVNQNMAELNTPIKDSDEVAFFPPMTGGNT